MQRLFSTFASGWPGAGLLLLRLALAGFLLEFVFVDDFAITGRGLAAVASLLIAIGIWTPIVGVLAAALQLWIASSNHQAWPCLLAASIGTALSLVGPGAFSIDGFRYGRKRVIFDSPK